MKYRVTYTAGAKKDLKNIFRYISERLLAPQNAVGQTERIMAPHFMMSLIVSIVSIVS